MLKIDNLNNFQFVMHFEYVAVLIMIVMVLYIIIEKLFVYERGKIITSLILITLVCSSLEIVKSKMINDIVLNNTDVESKVFMANIFQTTYFLLLDVSLFGFATYIAFITCGLDYINKSFIRRLSFYLPELIILGIIVANYFTTTVLRFEYDEKLILYINLPSFLTMIGLIFVFLTLSFILIVKFKSKFETKQLLGIALLLPTTLAGIFIEILLDNMLVLSFMISLDIILIITVLESYGDLIDPKTGMYNMDEFIKEIKKCYFVEGNKSLLLIKIPNYKELLDAYSTQEVLEYNIAFTKAIFKFRKKEKLKFVMYSLNYGYYAFVTDKDKHIQISIDDFIDISYGLDMCSDFIPKYELCNIEITSDFENLDDAINFVNNFREYITFNKELVIYKNVKDDKDLIIKNHLEQIIDTALKEKEFKVYYQPIYSIKEKKFVTAEALVRLISKKYGFISPATFIPYAENTGRVAEIDEFVMDEVFRFASTQMFEELGLEYIEINLSMAECIDPNLIDRFKKLLDKYKTDPKRINVEITESFDVSEQRVINSNLKKLVNLGFKLSLDDYGTGYSNINRFSTLPISIVKIDKSLVDGSDKTDIKNVLDYSFTLVNQLDKETVVEGVETKEQLDRFSEYGATFIQGYYFSKPLDFENYLEFVKSKNL